MAQIITLKDMQSRLGLPRHSHFETQEGTDMPRGPAQLLFFTGVRYERYSDVAPEAVKLVKRSRRKNGLPH